MALSDLYTTVGLTLGRGSSLDGRIPGWVEDAALFLEQNYTFQYMRKSGTIAIDAESATPWRVDMPSIRVKELFVLREMLATQGQEFYGDPLQQVEPKRVTALDKGTPRGFWLDGMAAICFDSVPQLDTTYQIHYSELTAWNTTGSGNPTLLQRYKGLLKAQSMLQAAAELRDTRLSEIWSDPNSLVSVPAQLSVALRTEEALKTTSVQYEIPYVPPAY